MPPLFRHSKKPSSNTKSLLLHFCQKLYMFDRLCGGHVGFQ